MGYHGPMSFRPPSLDRAVSSKASPSPDRRCSTAAEWGLDKQDKWKVASHLHKAIRHGRADDAEQGVRWLAEIEPAYLRYRMAVIAVEDVAAGSPALVRESFGEGWTKASIAARGEVSFLVEQARAWAGAVKDRTPCAWLSCTHFMADFEKKHGPWGLLPLGKSRRLAFSTDLPWWERGLAAWRAVGGDKLRGNVPAIPGDWDAYVEAAAEQGLSEDLLACMRVGGKAQGEAHPIFIPLAGLAQQREGVTIVEKNIPQAGYAGPWLSAALDKHTSEGKRALGRLLQRKSRDITALQAHGASREVVEDLVGRLWFWMEGGLLDKGLAYPTSLLIDRETKQRSLARGPVVGKELFEAFRNVSEWHAAREQSIGSQRWRGPSLG